ncbi:hypothetical protein BDN72DRAFT_837479 [Pluteus cervinus]|uniref:Uncharacterized protein n=1 Tax=Pluteus cervinus TaxID=181527 RepID=A0ACD3B0M9_9AGAR|nr:hypothetical protein BDN72DRAFT_837479 [Pluteus cervinus]
MSQYKSALRGQQPSSQPDDYKYRPQARQLQEMFPSWSNDDLQSLLNEVGGDVEVAATRITDGVAEQWGAVTRKKEKKGQTPGHTSKESISGRGDFRGARGGRGGRAIGRGGARGRGGVPRTVSTNGHISRTSSPKPPTLQADASLVTSDHNESAPVDGATTRSHEKPSPPESTDSPKTQVQAPASDPTVNGTSVHATTKPVPKLPTTQKLSWAQIARPQEKPIVTPAAPIPVPQQPTLPQQTTAASVPPSQPPAPSESPEIAPLQASSDAEPESSGWEEPTTVQPPSWDDEPSGKPAVSVIESSWPPSSEPVDQPKVEAIPEPVPEEKPEVLSPPPPPAQPDVEPVAEPRPLPAVSIQQLVAATPSPKLTTRPSSVAHRARHKTTDQPVVMPSSFGHGLEKIGMQFGSLNLNGDNVPEPQADVEVPAPRAPTPPPPREATPPPPPPPATAPASSSALSSTLFQQQQQSQALQQSSQPAPQHAPTQPATTSHHNPQPISQVSHASSIPATNSVATSSPLQHYTPQVPSQTQHALPSNHHQSQPQSHQSHAHHQYNQHGLSNHVDSPQQAAATPQSQATSHASYFRQSEVAASSPYFHTPTPPTSQTQENTYSSFGQLTGQTQHQQSSHVSSFTGSEYGYGDNQRGFYDSYSQQTGFGSRTALGHEDVKGLPATQQPSGTATHPPANTQTAQQHPTSQATQPQSASGQAPQQGYPPPPVPYYYNPYPQNQYYGTPYNSGYGVPQPFVKYPAMFQPGPPGPTTAPSPAGKQPGSNVGVGVNVQPQGNPYNQGLYQQGGYDDYPQHPIHSQHQQHSHSHTLGLGQGVGTGEYGKQLYGASGQGSIQGFMSLGQGGASTAGVPSSNATGPRAGNSPENAYKPYGNKDVGVSAAGRGVQQAGGPVQQQQGQGQAQGGQGPQNQPFYGGNRFGSGAGGVPPQAHHQQAAPQGHLGYPQSGNDGGFYPYQPRQQQGYW